jgi:hypothetical protein
MVEIISLKQVRLLSNRIKFPRRCPIFSVQLFIELQELRKLVLSVKCATGFSARNVFLSQKHVPRNALLRSKYAQK